ncbi:MAG: 4Fe-4S binding protein [Alphaproteobacteria bacterium]|nr:4Fe-4S binding protein [Alphaproteobacteria bacterium]
MAYKISNQCIACGTCMGVCQAMAISAAAGKYEIDPKKCRNCNLCASICPIGAIAKDKPAPAKAA